MAQEMTKAPKQAFSLVELSIVLVILGLLTGGILAGQSLIRAAELRSVSTDLQRYLTATNSFRDKYRALPGDMPNAVRFWGAQEGSSTDGVDSTCAGTTTAATGIATCNGNGSGSVGEVVANYHEVFRFWQHLANAGLVEGRFSGITGTGSNAHCIIGTNCPASRLSRGGFSASFRTTTGLGALVIPNGHMFVFGSQTTTGLTNGAILRAEEAWNIDSKLDDGLPGSGFVIGPTATARSGCTSSDTASTAAYVLTDTATPCTLFFHTRF